MKHTKRQLATCLALTIALVAFTSHADTISDYRKAAEQGDATAQANLGWCYENGEGVEKNMSEAVKWYRKAAEQGHKDAQCNLGVCYENGEGVEKDMTEAVKWYRKAAEQGNASALYNLGVRAILLRHGRGE